MTSPDGSVHEPVVDTGEGGASSEPRLLLQRREGIPVPEVARRQGMDLRSLPAPVERSPQVSRLAVLPSKRAADVREAGRQEGEQSPRIEEH